MTRGKQTKALPGASSGRSFFFLFTVILLNCLPLSPVLQIFPDAGPPTFLGATEVFAQTVNPQALSKYEAGLQAMKSGDCNKAKGLFKQAVELDSHDRSVRVGMFSTEYHPNAKLREAEAKCPSTTATALALSITSPSSGSVSVQNETDRTAIQGSVKGGEGTVRVTVNGKDAPVRDGRFSTDVPLNVGLNDITVRAVDSAGRQETRRIAVTRPAKEKPPTTLPEPPEREPPSAPFEMTIASPADARQSVPAETESVAIRGSIRGGRPGHKVAVNNRQARIESDGSFTASVPLRPGVNKITVRGTDGAGKALARELVITRAATEAPPAGPPSLSVKSPSQSAQSVPSKTDKLTVSGSVSGGEGTLKLTVNDREVKIDKRGTFTTSVDLAPGENRLTVRVKDSAGKQDAHEFVVTRIAEVSPPPALKVASPSETAQSVPFETDKVTVDGSASGGEGALKLTVNDKEVKIDDTGAFTASVNLTPGENKLSVKLKDAAGRQDSRDFVVTRLTKVFPPPALKVASPSEPAQSVPFETDKVTVGGSVSGGEGALKLTVNDKEVKIDNTGAFTASVNLAPGENKLSVKLKDAAGRQDGMHFIITRQAQVFPPPALIVSSPSEPSQSVPFETDKVTVGGSASGGEGALKLTVNDKEVKLDGRGAFTTSVTLAPGANRVNVRLSDSAGKQDSRDFVVTRQAQVFPPPALIVSSPSEPSQSVPFETGSVTVSGSASGGEGALKLTVNDKEVKLDGRGAFTTSVTLTPGANRVNVRLSDSAGKQDSRDFAVTRQAQVFPPPALSVASLSEAPQLVPFETDKLTVSGSVSGGEGALRLTVNDTEVKTDAGGAFSASVTLAPGENRVSVRLRDSAGKESAKSYLVTRRPEEPKRPPALSVHTPSETCGEGKVSLRGTVSGGTGQLTLIIDGRKESIGDTGSFETCVTLRPGANRIVLRVEDSAGKSDKQTWLLYSLPTSRK